MKQSFEAYTWVPFVRNNSIEAYATQIRLNISDGVFEVTHINESTLLTVVMYGFLVQTGKNVFQGYAHPGWIIYLFIYLFYFIITLWQVCQGSASNWCLQPKTQVIHTL